MRAATEGRSSWLFRAASLSDVEAVVALVESAYRGEASRAGWTTEADLLDGQRTDASAVSEMIGRPDSVVLLASEDGAGLVGCCHLEHRPGGAAYFGMFAVRPGEQGRGVGRAMLAEARRRAAETWGADRLVMSVIRQREDLLSWYAGLGYLPTGETEPFPYGDERFGRPLRPDLEFVILEGPIDDRRGRAG